MQTLASNSFAVEGSPRVVSSPTGPAHRQVHAGHPEWNLVGESPITLALRENLRLFGPCDAPVLVTGESGTGKELVAEALHLLSDRAGAPFVAVNCAAIPESLVESELFGHERGAFTGAVRRRLGRFQAAHGGTLFLDEVGELPLAAQAKLLRALESGRVDPVGSDRPEKVDVRLISATHRGLSERIEQRCFREDLYYRLKVLHIRVPPLRDRPGDLRPLVAHFLRRLAPGPSRCAMTERAWEALRVYPFPGNVRELEHALQHAIILARGRVIDVTHLPPEIIEGAPDRMGMEKIRPLAAVTREFEQAYVRKALRQSHGHRTQAARALGISRKTLWEKLRTVDDG